MRILQEMNRCYGCSACYNICPVNAIKMLENEEGFLMPSVNIETCIHCNACRRVCPVLNASYPNDVKPTVVGMMAEDTIRKMSSSGGAFMVIANYIFENEGVICGAILDEKFEVHHTIVENKDDIHMLQGTKYVQSRIGDTYKKIAEHLNHNKMVFFTGTPCQVAGLYGFLGEKGNSSQLITADLICHGIPSPKAWRIFLNSIRAGKSIETVEWRSKKMGWKSTHDARILYTDGTETFIPYQQNFYNKAFINNKISRKSCNKCQFSCCPRQGDFSIGDFWGAGTYDKKFDDGNGTSILFLNNDKAKNIWKNVNPNLLIKSEVVSLEEVIKKNPNIYRLSRINLKRDHFLKILMETESFEKAEEASESVPYDVGLITWFWAMNYGAVLTSYALATVISDMGYSCSLIDIPVQYKRGDSRPRDPMIFSKRFIFKKFNVTPQYNLEKTQDILSLNNSFNTFIVGSDQLWRWEWIKNAYDFFFLGFADDSKNKFSYATSFGGGSFTCNDEKYLSDVDRKLRRFSGISVREKNGKNICKNSFGLEAIQVLDPVFLLEKEHYKKLSEFSKVKKRKFIVAHMISYMPEKEVILRKLSNILKSEIILIPDATKNYHAGWEMPVTTDIEIEDFLYYIKNSDLVITDSFHGMCFSIIFGIPFIATTEGRAAKDRFTSLLNMIQMQDRLLPEFKDILQRQELLFDNPDFSFAHKKLAAERIKSFSWLLSKLEKTQTNVETEVQKFHSMINDLENEQLTLDEAFVQMKWFKEIYKSLMRDKPQLLRGTNGKMKLVPSAMGTWENGRWKSSGYGKGANRELILLSDAPDNNIKTGWKLRSSSGNVGIQQDFIPVTPGRIYTMSCYAKGYGKLGLTAKKMVPINHEEWKRYTYTFESESDLFDAYFYVNRGEINICGMKLEENNTATRWIP